MNPPARRSLASLIVGGLLLGGGALTAVGSLASTLENEYTVTVSAPPGVSWTLSVPRPLTNITTETVGTISLGGEIETPQGPLANLTGLGNASIRYRLITTVFPWSARTSLQISGFDGRQGGYVVWRESSDANAVIRADAFKWWEERRFGILESCAGSGFGGAVQEGWNVVRDVVIADCFVSPWPRVAAAVASGLLSGTGAFVIVTAHRRAHPVSKP